MPSRKSSFRSGEKEQGVTPVFHAWADFIASADGTIDADAQVPVSGTFTGADPRRLSGGGSAAITEQSAGAVWERTLQFLKVRADGPSPLT